MPPFAVRTGAVSAYRQHMTSSIVARGEKIAVTIGHHGAEPISLRDEDDHEYLWSADDPWKRRAPVLFPVICRVPDDRIRVGDETFPMPQHGFARDLPWTVVDSADDRVSLVLVADDDTRRHYPYDFALAVTYVASERSLTTRYTVENRGDEPMPFALGSHPAFVWPLEEGQPRSMHQIRFDEPETAPVRRVVDNLLTDERFDNPAWDHVMTLNDAWFTDGAVIMPEVASQGLVYSSGHGRQVRLTWEGFTGITLWSVPGAKFVCIEPWRGQPAPVDFVGQFAGKPGNVVLPPGGREELSYRVELL
jgi:galactose mutarotase-like enzyme